MLYKPQIIGEGNVFHRILAATALPNQIDPPVVSALKLAAAHQADLVVLHVLPAEPGPANDIGPWTATDAVPYEDADQVLAGMQHRYQKHSQIYSHLRFETRRGTAWETIAKTASWIDADAIVLGPHVPGRHLSSAHGKLTGTAQGVLHRAARPVMIAGRNISIRMTRMKTIVVCIDFSDSCRLALLLAARLAREHDSNVYLLHIHGIPPFPGYTQQHYIDDTRRLKQHLQIFANQNAPGLSCELAVLGGSQPHGAILNFVQSLNADLVVMGSGSGSQNRRWYVGSAVENVSRECYCPVAVVPTMQSGTDFQTE